MTVSSGRRDWRSRVSLSCALACLLSACGGLDPAVEGSVVFTAEWPGGFVFDDSALLEGLVGDRELSDEIVAAAACHSLLGHAGDWSVRPHAIVSPRVDFVRAAELVDDGSISPDDAAQIEAFLHQRRIVGDVDVAASTIAQRTTVRTPVVEEYLRLRSQEPSDDALARFAAYVQNVTQSEQRLVVIDRFGLSEVDFDGLSGQYSSVPVRVTSDAGARTLDRSECAGWLVTSGDP